MFAFQAHTADIKIKFKVENYDDLFQEGINALKEFLEPKLKGGKIKKDMNIESIDEATLFVDYLNELISIIQAEKVFPIEVKIKNLDKKKLSAELFFKKYDKIIKDIKAATYHNLNLIKKNGISLEVILDI